MQISIIDHGPLRAKVTIVVDGQSVAFPEHSFRQLGDLMFLLGATQNPAGQQAREPAGQQGRNNWTLDPEEVRSQVFQVEREVLTENVRLLERKLEKVQSKATLDAQVARDRISGLIDENKHLQDIIHEPIWRKMLRFLGGSI